MRALAMLFGLALCGLIHWVLTRPSLSSWRRRVLVLAIMAPVCAESFAWVNFFAEMAADPSLNLSALSWAWCDHLVLTPFRGRPLLCPQLSTSVSRSLGRCRRAPMPRTRALHRINPHFLFNSLNSVSADPRRQAAKADLWCRFRTLRMGLHHDRATIRSPANRAAAPSQIEQLRYPDLRSGRGGRLEDALVPSLILQPIVENAVKYGAAGSPPPSRSHQGDWGRTAKRRGRLAIGEWQRQREQADPPGPGSGSERRRGCSVLRRAAVAGQRALRGWG